METDTQSPLRFFLEIPAEPSDATAPINVNYADVERSENNILRWMSYLPEDCIKAMIDMGWDVTT
jgi:hypothetical protein